jgi:hypothetical protein
MFQRQVGVTMAVHGVCREIPVIFVNGEIGNVHGYTLDHLIQEKEIAAFRRSEGWVLVGDDPIRTPQPPMLRSGNRWNDIPP